MAPSSGSRSPWWRGRRGPLVDPSNQKRTTHGAEDYQKNDQHRLHKNKDSCRCVPAGMQRLRERASVIVRGNHDHAVGYDVDPRCSSPFRAMAEATRQLAMTTLSEAR